jgi:lincosamide nucleotidyltransferase B/F
MMNHGCFLFDIIMMKEVFDMKHLLLERLDQIGQSISTQKGMLALLGLGSVGVELSRLDDQSDLDFFVITEIGFKQHYIDDLLWLENVRPIPYRFKNTNDGYKFMFDDGIYGEFAVFDVSEMDHVTQAEGRIVWIKPGTHINRLTEAKGTHPIIHQTDVKYRLEEALTNLYVGLSRAIRGEVLSGYRFIESYAIGNLLSVIHHFEVMQDIHDDLFNIERRFETHFPTFLNLKFMLQGYQHIALSSQAILDYIDSKYAINPFFHQQIQQKIDTLSKIESCYNDVKDVKS